MCFFILPHFVFFLCLNSIRIHLHCSIIIPPLHAQSFRKSLHRPHLCCQCFIIFLPLPYHVPSILSNQFFSHTPSVVCQLVKSHTTFVIKICQILNPPPTLRRPHFVNSLESPSTPSMFGKFFIPPSRQWCVHFTHPTPSLPCQYFVNFLNSQFFTPHKSSEFCQFFSPPNLNRQ